MIKTLNAGLAALGLIATGTVTALVTTGALEGVTAIPGWMASGIGIAVLAGAFALAGHVAVDLDPRRPYVATGIPAVIVLAIGYAASTASESAVGEGLEYETVYIIAGGVLAMMTTSTLVAQRRVTRRSPDGSEAPDITEP